MFETVQHFWDICFLEFIKNSSDLCLLLLPRMFVVLGFTIVSIFLFLFFSGNSRRHKISENEVQATSASRPLFDEIIIKQRELKESIELLSAKANSLSLSNNINTVDPRNLLPAKLVSGDSGDPVRFQNKYFLKIGSRIYAKYKLPCKFAQYIDIPEFQRLKDIYQLGNTASVFPDAAYNRFVHSLGVAHLATKVMLHLAMEQPELGITQRMVELVGFTGLYHDSGHTFSSHSMDKVTLPALYARYLDARADTSAKKADEQILEQSERTDPDVQEQDELLSFEQYFDGMEDHEKRAVRLIYYLREKYKWDWNDQEMQFISSAIQGIYRPELPYGQFMYCIVNNTICGWDVDKCDYLERDLRCIGRQASFNYKLLIDGLRVHPDTKELWFDGKTKDMFRKVAEDRYTLHQQVYQHATVKKVDCMMKDLLLEADDVLNLRQLFISLNCSWTKLTNGLLYDIKHSDQYSLKAKNLLLRIETRQFYCLDKRQYYNHGMQLNESILTKQTLHEEENHETLRSDEKEEINEQDQEVQTVQEDQEVQTVQEDQEVQTVQEAQEAQQAEQRTLVQDDSQNAHEENKDELVTATVSYFGGDTNTSKHFFENMKFYFYNRRLDIYDYVGTQKWPMLPLSHKIPYLICKSRK